VALLVGLARLKVGVHGGHESELRSAIVYRNGSSPAIASLTFCRIILMVCKANSMVCKANQANQGATIVVRCPFQSFCQQHSLYGSLCLDTDLVQH